MAGKLQVEPGVEPGAGVVHAAPALVRIAEGEGEPLPAHRLAGDELGRVRGDEGGVGQPALPLPADLDQVVAVGTVAMEEHDKLLCRARTGWKARAGEGCRHRPLSVFTGSSRRARSEHALSE